VLVVPEVAVVEVMVEPEEMPFHRIHLPLTMVQMVWVWVPELVELVSM
jgi:hypothetical protein